MFDKKIVQKMNEADRRRFMGRVASSLLGVAVAPKALQAFDSEKGTAGHCEGQSREPRNESRPTNSQMRIRLRTPAGETLVAGTILHLEFRQ